MKDTAILFSGQGAQYVGMGQQLNDSSAAARHRYEEASDFLGYDLLGLDETALADTRYAQLATFTLSMAAYAAVQEGLGMESGETLPNKPVLAGFSLGEYTALCAAEVIDFPTALKLINYRSEVMAEAAAASDGAMYAILGLDDLAIVTELTADNFLDRVFPANYNSPGQLVIAGHAADCEVAANRFLELGAKRAVKLNVSGAFHTVLMKPAAEKLAAFSESLSFEPKKLPLFSNVLGQEMPAIENMPAYLARHMINPVRWTDTIKNLQLRGVSRYLELGPGKTLVGLAKRVDRKAQFLNVEDQNSLQATLLALQSE